ncbi:hypothetical protein rosag_20510 [Roseisolibacter agri]|uniref:Lipoprotein n=1 Tax=Roseisolibacter agri TaxID=2014610 RepID=A0AA37QGU3_9BACT|nr:hypothetical protein rosag_20510 [Roseisolibacter agri]
MRPSTLRRLSGILVLLSGACARPSRLPATIPAASGEPRVAYALRMLDLAERRGAAAAQLERQYGSCPAKMGDYDG